MSPLGLFLYALIMIFPWTVAIIYMGGTRVFLDFSLLMDGRSGLFRCQVHNTGLRIRVDESI